MADYFVDHGVYTSALGTTPTWAAPQEGDGQTKDAATASSVGSIVLNALPAATNLLSICGITFGATSGGTVNYTIGGTITATVDNIVSAINGCTTAVGSTVAVGVPQLRNLVFARNTGGTTVEIMMRVGSTLLNHATNANVAMTQSGWGTPCTITNFIGGTGGCWGWFLNIAAIGVSSSIAIFTYGIAFHTPMVRYGTPTMADRVMCRTGSGKTLTYSSGATSMVATRVQTWPMRLFFDTNTIWTGDSGTGVFLIDMTGTANYISFYLIFQGATAQVVDVIWHALMQGGCKIKGTLTGANSVLGLQTDGNTGSYGGPTALIVNIAVENASAVAGTGGPSCSLGTVNSYSYGYMRWRNCTFTITAASSTLLPLLTFANSNGNPGCIFEGCTFTWNINTAAQPGHVFKFNVGRAGQFLRVIGCTFTGWPLGDNKFTLANVTASAYADLHIVAENCTGLALTSAGTGLSGSTLRSMCDPHGGRGAFWQSGDVGGPMRHELGNGMLEFDPAASPAFPLLASVQPDGTAWSWRITWTNNNESCIGGPLMIPLDMLYRDTAATRTITVHMMIRTAFLAYIDFGKVCLMVNYVANTDAKQRTEFSHAVPVTSGSSWTNAGSYSTYTAYKVTLTTSLAIKTNTRLRASVMLQGNTDSAQAETLYLDPEFGVA